MLQISGRDISGVAFDLEGTIIDLEPQHFAAHVKTAESLGITLDLDNPDTFTNFVPHFVGGPDAAVIDDIVNLAIGLGLLRELDENSRREKSRELSDYDKSTFTILRDSLDEIPPREGFLTFFEQLKSQNIPVAIGSLTSREDALILLEKSGLDKLVSHNRIILKEDVSSVKPDPEVYVRTAERMGILPTNQLVFEDSHNGIIAAREAGSLTIGMPTMGRIEIIDRLRQEGAAFVFNSWNEVNLRTLTLEGNTPGKERK